MSDYKHLQDAAIPLGGGVYSIPCSFLLDIVQSRVRLYHIELENAESSLVRGRLRELRCLEKALMDLAPGTKAGPELLNSTQEELRV